MGQKGYVPDPGSATLLGRYRYHGDFSPTLFCMIALIHKLTPTSAYLGQMQQLKWTAVLRIHTTMMWIRIRLLITGGDPDPAFDFDADPEVTTKNDLSNFLPR